jgi:hypothetical protein
MTAFTPKYTPEQWAEARRLRAEGLTFREIAERVGFRHPNLLAARAKREGWPAGRDAASPAANAAPRKTPGRRPSPATADIRRALAQRLYRLIDLNIRKMEMRMQKELEEHKHAPPGAEPPVVTHEDRESFAAIIESINQVTEMASEPASAAEGGRKFAVNPELTALSDDIDAAGLAAASEKDQYRRELAEHLGKMFPKP